MELIYIISRDSTDNSKNYKKQPDSNKKYQKHIENFEICQV